MTEYGFRSLVAWQKAMDFVDAVYEFSESFPASEKYGLTRQIRQAAISIPSNIAEGRGRGTPRDYGAFVLRGRGSLYEVETQALIASRRGFASTKDTDKLLELSAEACRIINGLITIGRNEPVSPDR
ncbi:MAG TPA: four helix bundle protein [Thermoanaerobaculia bacterium]|jgi:four helix bundle protein|nr:four helix bundle protein [Thermoanaerobaculia bacterium]